MRVLVTGGAGFIASHLVDALLRKGHDVVVVDDLSSGREENLNSPSRFYRLDICSPDMQKVFHEEKPELVIHHAAQIDVRRSVTNPEEDARINIQGLLNLLSNSVRYEVKGFIFASSGGAIYGEPEKLPVNEEHPKGPLSPYGISKLASEYYLYYFARVHGLPYISLRYGNVYGPRQDPYGEAGVVAIFAQKMLTGETPTVYGDGEQLRDYVYVEDVVQANLLAVQKILNGIDPAAVRSIDDLAYNIGTGRGISVNELFRLLKEATGFQGEANYGSERAGELKRIFLDPEKAGRELGWRPKVPLEEGLRHTVEYIRLNRQRKG